MTILQTSLKFSVVIPTRNRSTRVKNILTSLKQQTYRPAEIIIVDASDDLSYQADIGATITGIPIIFLASVPSVCIQRNIGIEKASHDWIFLCDDDLELPEDYLEKVTYHIQSHPEAGAVSGTVLQKYQGKWIGQYPITSAVDLVKRYIFNLGMWGPIALPVSNILTNYIKNYYFKKGNHITKAGWPAITDFSGIYFRSRVYGLGASVIKKEWLLRSPYDEVLDPHGIGDNYGVALGFPKEGVHILANVFVYHFEAQENRLNQRAIYYRRILALHYFIITKKDLFDSKTRWLLWSLVGNLLSALFTARSEMIYVNLKLITEILFKKNPYLKAKEAGLKTITPEL